MANKFQTEVYFSNFIVLKFSSFHCHQKYVRKPPELTGNMEKVNLKWTRSFCWLGNSFNLYYYNWNSSLPITLFLLSHFVRPLARGLVIWSSEKDWCVYVSICWASHVSGHVSVSVSWHVSWPAGPISPRNTGLWPFWCSSWNYVLIKNRVNV